MLLVLLAPRLALAEPVIPRGREAQLLELLSGGQELPGGCRLDDVSVERSAVLARYRCKEGERRVELSFPQTETAVRTERFAVRFDPSGAADFEQTVLREIRARETGWAWVESALTERAPGRMSQPLHTPRDAIIAIVLAAIATAMFTWALRTTRGGAAPASAPFDRREAGALLFAAVVSWLYLRASTALPPAHADTARDLLLARECELHGCTAGPPTSAALLLQGSLWPRILGLFLRFGLGTAAIQDVLLASEALGALAVAWTLRRHGASGSAWIAAFVSLLLLHHVAEQPILWGPSLLPVALAVAHAMFLRGVTSGHWGHAALLGASLAAAAESHVVCAPLVPATAILLFATGWPLRSLAAYLASSTLVLAASPVTWRNNLAVLPSAILLPLAVGSLGVAVVLRRRASSRDAEARTRLAFTLWFAACVAVPVLVAGRASMRANPRYLATAALAASLGAGVFARRVAGRLAHASRRGAAIGLAAATAVTLSTLRVRRSPRPGWTYPDAERVWAALEARGWSYARLRTALVCDWALLDAIGPLDGRLGGAGPGRGATLLVMRARAGLRAPAPATVVELRGGDEAWIIDIGGGLSLSATSECIEDPKMPPRCVQLAGLDAEETSLTARAYLARRELQAVWPELVTAPRLRVRATVLGSSGSGAIHAGVLDPSWQFVGAEGGLERDVALSVVPIEGVKLEAVRSREGSGAPTNAWPPPIFVVPEALWREGIGAALRAGR